MLPGVGGVVWGMSDGIIGAACDGRGGDGRLGPDGAMEL